MSLNDGVKGQVKIHQGLTQDDHNVGAISILPDGRYLTAFADHNYERISYFRISKHPHDPTSWQKVTTFNHKAPVTYSNLFTVISKSHHKLQPTEQQKTLINFNRSGDYDPNLLTSNDNGKTWQVFANEGFYTLASDNAHILAAGSEGKVAVLTISNND